MTIFTTLYVQSRMQGQTVRTIIILTGIHVIIGIQSIHVVPIHSSIPILVVKQNNTKQKNLLKSDLNTCSVLISVRLYRNFLPVSGGLQSLQQVTDNSL